MKNINYVVLNHSAKSTGKNLNQINDSDCGREKKKAY